MPKWESRYGAPARRNLGIGATVSEAPDDCVKIGALDYSRPPRSRGRDQDRDRIGEVPEATWRAPGRVGHPTGIGHRQGADTALMSMNKEAGGYLLPHEPRSWVSKLAGIGRSSARVPSPLGASTASYLHSHSSDEGATPSDWRRHQHPDARRGCALPLRRCHEKEGGSPAAKR